MIKGTTETICEWNDIQKEMEKRTGIKDLEGVFNKTTGKLSDQSDPDSKWYCFWHIMTDDIVPNMTNDTIVRLYRIEDETKERYIKKHGEWSRIFFDAYQQILN